MQTKPICKTIAPELYSRHTKHMSRAKKLSYNYANIDDYIVEHFGKKSIRQMAEDLNEYFDRVVYRYQVLQDKGIIMSPRKRRRLEMQIKELELQMIDTYVDIKRIKRQLTKLDKVNV